VAFPFAYKVSQYLIYEWPQSIAMEVTNNPTPKIIGTPLMLILPWMYPQYVIIQFGIVYH